MKAVSLCRKTFFEHVGCDNADIFEDNYVLIGIIGNMLVNNLEDRIFYTTRPEGREFLDFIDGRGFKVTRLTINSYRVKIL